MSDPLGFLERARGDEPSELALDRYSAGELDGADKARVEAWLAADPARRARVERRRTFPAGLDADRLFARIADGVHDARASVPAATAARAPRPHPRPVSWWRRLLSGWGAGGLALVAAAAVALLIVRPWDASGPAPLEPDVLRVKGGLGFTVHRATADGSEVLVSGSLAREGDRLRFEVAVDAASHVMIVDQDPSGALATAWPLGNADAARVVMPEVRALDGAVELDGALGKEWLFAVACPTAFALGDVRATAAGVLKAPSEACRVSPFLLDKVAR